MPVIIQPSPGGGSVTISDSAGVPAGGAIDQVGIGTNLGAASGVTNIDILESFTLV